MVMWEVCGKSELYWRTWTLVATPSTTFHRYPHCTCVTQRAPNTGTSTYALKSWGGHPRCDLAPQGTSFGTVALRERQHLAMADITFHATPPRTVPHVPNDHAPHWCSVHAETDARSRRLQEVRQRVQLRSTSGARGVVTRLVGFTMIGLTASAVLSTRVTSLLVTWRSIGVWPLQTWILERIFPSCVWT